MNNLRGINDSKSNVSRLSLSSNILGSSTSNLNSSVSSFDSHRSPKPPPHRISRRSISRHPPSGSTESYIDVLTIVGSFLGPTTPLNPHEDENFEKLLEEKVDFLQDVLTCDFQCNSESLEDLSSNYKRSITVKENEEASINLQSYEADLSNFSNLRREIKSSDHILDSLQTYLMSFQEGLNTLSADMETLETRSRSLNQKLIICQLAEKKLAPVVEALIIPPAIVRQISDGEISLQWLSALKYISQRQNELSVMLKERGEFVAIEAAEQQLKFVSRKAVERIRDFIGTKIKSLRVFGVNSQAVQKDLLSFRDLYTFLKLHHSSLANDILQAYVNTMSWYYSSYFQRYVKALEKVNIHRYHRNVLLGSDEGNKRGLLFSRSTQREKTSMQALTDSLSLRNRANIITSDDPSVLLAQVAEISSTGNSTSSIAYYMETSFRSLNLALLDNATVEYQFLQDFFRLKAGDQVNKIFDSIFEKTFAVGQDFTSTFLTDDSYDAYGILICIRLCRKLEFELQHRRVPVMENYLNLQLINLWPKFQSVMDAHCESLHRSSSRSSLHSFISDSSVAGSGIAGSGLGSAALVPHPLTQAFSSFLAGILTLCENEDSKSEPVARSVLRLRNEFESVLTKLSTATFDSAGKGQGTSKQEKFLYNNYFLVSTILSDLSGPLAEQEKDHFRLLTDAYGPKK